MNPEPLHKNYTGIIIDGDAQVEINNPILNFHGDSINKQPQFTEEEVEQGIIHFLEAVEHNFNSLKLFHTRQEVPLLKQYIPIRVTLERKFTHEVERIGEYRETELELRDIYALKGGREEENEVTVEDWQKAKKDHNRIIVLADPGMGKSTLLRMEAVTIARKELDRLSTLMVGGNPSQPPLKREENFVFPLLFRLSDLAESEGELIDLIPQLVERDYRDLYQVISRILREKLVQGNCVLLLDALDEVPREKRIKLGEKLTRFLKGNTCRVIVTSRIVGYGGGFLEQEKEMEIVPFTAKQTEEYIQTWFINAVRYLEDNSVSAQGLIDELKNKPQIQGLAQNPLLLSLLCSLYQQKDLILPAQRCQVYEKAVDYMLRQWTKNRKQVTDFRLIAKKILLGNLAYKFSCRGQEVFTDDNFYDVLEDYLINERVPTVFRNITSDDLMIELCEEDGIIQKFHEEGKQYLFLHRTFQEYFSACYFHQAILHNQQEGIELVKGVLWDYDWHETLSLLAGLLENPTPLIKEIYQQKDDIFYTQLLLAGRCIAECRNLSNPVIGEIIDKIYSFWYSHSSFNFMTSLVISIGHTFPEILERLKNNLGDSDKNIRRATLAILMDIGTPEATKILISALEDVNLDNSIKCSIIKFLTKMDTSDALAALASAAKMSDRAVKRMAKVALADKVRQFNLTD